MFFFKTPEGMWVPCGPKHPGAIQITMQDLASKGLAEKVILNWFYNQFVCCVMSWNSEHASVISMNSITY